MKGLAFRKREVQTPANAEGGYRMADKKDKACNIDKKGKPTISNDQLGENAGEGRFEKTNGKGNKCR